MCGIFGMIGQQSVEKTICALKQLEYRGYDSVGIAVKSPTVSLYKSIGRVDGFAQQLPQNLQGEVSIGHTRWATHGKVSNQNAHPFLSADGNFAIVHNGIIENYLDLKKTICQTQFTSQTDSEVIAHLLQSNYDNDLLQSVTKTANMLVGSFAVAVVNNYNDNLYAFCRHSPLVVGFSEEGVYVCSDVRCISHYAKKVAIVPDDTIVVATAKNIEFFSFQGKKLTIDYFEPQKAEQMCDNQGDMMLKEIFEIPQKITQAKKYHAQHPLALPKALLKKLKRIYFLGCGTAYHAGLQTCAVCRKFMDVELIPVIASEVLYDNYVFDKNTLVFCISQSGETADTLRAVEKINNTGAVTVGVTNTMTSTLARKCAFVTNVCADGEFAVASTKAYNCQLVSLLLCMMDIALRKKTLSQKTYDNVLESLDKLPMLIDKMLADTSQIQSLAQQIKTSSSVFYLGRVCDYPTACEGSLKLKEITYLHSEAYPAGEIKHGTLALVEKGVTVVAISTNVNLTDKMQSSVNEVHSRGAKVVGISPYNMQNATTIVLPTVHEFLYGIIAVVPLQLLAYFVAKALGKDVDKPRNLAKSVTVE